MREVRVWDLPLRLFHWLLALAVTGALVSGQIGGNLMVWHGRLGVLVAGLLGFRLAWGLVGSTHARFASFVRGPAAIRAYLQGTWHGLGHNPLGALSVLGMLAALGLQTASGLFGNDDIAFQGPLYPLVSKDTSDWVTGLHRKGFWLILLLITTHLAAIVFYLKMRGDNLIHPMITGRKSVTAAAADPEQRGGGTLALILALTVGLATAYGASGAWQAPPPPVPAAAPAW
ncbi:cytochrome b/b6 domain-containing protein [Zoogloea sp.]|uniref:cytochrome b/b6 domain-containing protein n=1 Tax=Zoogloea sp. TaxID=49181 RepID=UPI001A4F0843|nr:cytochrome b/b6 domain-containing protein [Zoogloea sp.]